MTGALPPEMRARLRCEPFPMWVPPMLATLTDERFSDDGWLFERKLDGERCLAYRPRRGPVKLMTRNRIEVSTHYPEVSEALAAQDAAEFVVDGEVVAFAGNATSFARLQRRMQVSDSRLARATGVAVYYYVFDVLHVDGYDTRDLTLRERKAVLRRLLSYQDPVRYTAHRNADGERFWHDACQRGWEGLIAKDATAGYGSGRSRKWLKFPCTRTQEFVIGGYTEPKGSRTGFGALLLGYHDGGQLVYAGRVGTGFDRNTLTDLTQRLQELETGRPPFGRGTPGSRATHWVRPELVGQVTFTEWTRDGQLRHPRFAGLRRDKPARDVTRERVTPTRSGR